MKRITAMLAVILAAALLAPAACAETGTGEYPDFAYTLAEDGSAVITGYSGTDTDLSVPGTVDGHAVSAVGKGAFRGNGQIRSLALPEGVRLIDDEAFRDCAGLESVLIPGTVERIGDSAFRLCESLSGLELPEGIRVIGANAFLGCEKLGEVKIPDSAEVISAHAFSFCSLASADLGSGVREIGDQAFLRNDFTEIRLPDSLETVGKNPFNGCKKLQDIQVSSGHPALETADGVLYSRADRRLVCCPLGVRYPDLAVQEGTEVIGAYAFDGATRCHGVKLPDSVTTIGDEAFSLCDAVIEIPESVTWMGANPFWAMEAGQVRPSAGNRRYEMLEEGDGVVLYDRQDRRIIAGFGTSFTLPEDAAVVGAQAFQMNGDLKEAVLPDGVTVIEDEAFYYCPELERVVLPESVEFIGNGVFEDCDSLVCVVKPGSYAEAYCRENDVPYTAAEAEYTEKAAKLFVDGKESGEITLRYYADTPDVAYIGFIRCAALLKKSPMTLQENGDGTVTLRNGQGGELLCDPAAGILTANDWTKVANPPLPLENEAVGMKDMPCGFARIVDIAYEGEPVPVVFSFAKYGIRMYADGEDVYLPVSTLSNLLTDIATNHLRYDGENVYLGRISLGGPETIVTSDVLRKKIAGGERPEDVVKQDWADLCFSFDYFFGHPGTAPLDAAIGEKGLEQAVAGIGEEGEEIRKGLSSASLLDYLEAEQLLFIVYLGDGHTAQKDIMSLMMDPAFQEEGDTSRNNVLSGMMFMLRSEKAMSQIENMAITPQRSEAWGDDPYRESGSTAVIRLDTFMPDEEAWAKWYGEGGELPQDCVGTVVSGLRRAAANPEIRNVVFDVSCNGGGASDVLMMILGLTTGQNRCYGFNRLTGQRMVLTYETDTNLDGVFDEKDKEARYDFNYGVLTTRQAFSCANLFPFLMREGGAVIIGEPTSGGTCSIQMGVDHEGFRYVMSSAQWMLTDAEGNSVEGGCPVDLPIDPLPAEAPEDGGETAEAYPAFPDFTNFFDAENLDRLMNEWFGQGQELAPAA